MALFAIRPEPGLAATKAAGAAAGLAIGGEPLFEIEAVPWEPVDPEAIDGLLVGSANTFRQGGEGLQRLAGKPVYAVGATTAEAARAAGFAVAATGGKDLTSLVATLKPPLRLLRPAGEERVPLVPPRGITVEERTVYRAKPLPLSRGFAEDLRGADIVLIHSAAAGRHFADECARTGVARDRLGIAALAPRILLEIGAGWAWTAAPRSPNEAALLALVRDLCLTGDGSNTNER